ncbi:hypothetical protein QE152_g13297 [Popillia japonica]|uniref:Uncharacterized protein n=1 Tax=Popillia japonica TaxID=7064 RepID=A0AAW1LAL8_POPJA
MVWPGWGSCGPVWSSVTRLGSVWSGLGWCGLAGVRVARFGVVSPGWGRCGPVWDGVAWLGFVWPGLEWCHAVGVGVARQFFRLAGELYNPVAPREDFDEEWSDVGEDEDFIE